MCLKSKLLNATGSTIHESFKSLRGKSYNVDFLTRCGTCLECRIRKTRDWIVRNYYEYSEKSLVLYCTLTYSDSCLPHDNYICFDDFQKFNKRLRRRLVSEYGDIFNYTYMACAEYGTKSSRPHFHFLMYMDKELAPSFREIIKPSQLKTYSGILKYDSGGRPLLQSALFESCWKVGNSIFVFPNATYDSELISYLTVYSTKNSSIKKLIEISKCNRNKKEVFLKKYFYPKFLKKCWYSKNVSRETFSVSCNPFYRYVLYFRTFESFLKKSDYSQIKERIVSSTSLGYSSFYKNKEQYFKDGCVYIAGTPYHIPLSWLYKLCNENYPPAIDYYLNNMFLYSQKTRDELKNEKEFSRIKTLLAEKRFFTKNLPTEKNNNVYRI